MVREGCGRVHTAGAGGPVRTKIGIAAQSVGVVALLAFVYLTFLRSQDSGELSGIEVENGTELPAPPPDDPDRGRGRDRGDRAGADPNDASKSRKAAKTPAAGEGIVDLPTGSVDTPAGSQYEDTVARILDQVGSAHP